MIGEKGAETGTNKVSQPGLFGAASHRAATLFGRGQWASTLRRPAYSSGEATYEEKMRAYRPSTQHVSMLFARVPARSEDRSSVYIV